MTPNPNDPKASGGYKSFARWPDGNVTDDLHDTKEQAEAVCQRLCNEGLGGDGQQFPVKTWVEPVAPKASREGKAVPEGYELLSPEFLRKHGAQEGMKRRMKNGTDWYPSNYQKGDEVKEIHLELFDYCGPIGTIAAATTPLPEGKCDCDLERYGAPHDHHPSCSIHRRYRHILPHALAALDEKPKGLIYANIGQSDWIPCDFPFPWKITDADSRLAYAIPVQAEPAPTRQEGEGLAFLASPEGQAKFKTEQAKAEEALGLTDDTQQQGEGLETLWNSEAPEGKTWKCPDCGSQATLGGNAAYHVRKFKHALPTLVDLPAPTAPPEPTDGQGEPTDSEMLDWLEKHPKNGSLPIKQTNGRWYQDPWHQDGHNPHDDLRSAIRAAMKGEGR